MIDNVKVAVTGHARACGDELADDDVLLEPHERVDLPLDRGVCQDARGLLEGGRREEGIRRERCLRDAEQDRFCHGGLAVLLDRLRIRRLERVDLDVFARQELRRAGLFDLDLVQHLPHHDLDVLVVDLNTLRLINLLHLVDEVALGRLQSADAQNIMGVDRSLGDLIAGLQHCPVAHGHACAERHGILTRDAALRRNRHRTHSLAGIFNRSDALVLRDDRVVLGLARLKELLDARQTLGDVVARDAARVERAHRELRARFADRLRGDNADCLADLDLCLIGEIPPIALHADAELRFAGQHAADGDAFADAFDPLRELLVHGVVDMGDHLARRFVHNVLCEHASDDAVGKGLDDAGPLSDRLDLNAAHIVVADMEFMQFRIKDSIHHFVREHRALAGEDGSFFGDGLAHDFLAAQLTNDRRACLLALARIWLAERDALCDHRIADGSLHIDGGTAHHDLADIALADGLEDLVIEHGILRIEDILGLGIIDRRGKQAAHQAVHKEFQCVKSRLCEPRAHLHEVDRRDIAVLFADDDILRHVDEAAGEIARVRRTQRRISKAFACAVRGNEVIGDGESLAEVRRNRQIDDLARGIRHESAHACELAHLLLVSARAGVRHHEDGVERVHVLHHGVCYVICRLRPELDDLLVALVLGNQTAAELTLDLVDLRLRIRDDFLFLRRDDDIGYGDRHACDAGVVVAEIFHMVDDLGRLGRTEVIVAVGDELAEFLLVHENTEAPLAGLRILSVMTEFVGQDLAENKASERTPDKAVALNLHADLRLQIEHLLLIRKQRLGDARKDLALTLCTGPYLREVVGAEHHVLRGDNDRLAVLRREDVIRREHEDACLGLRLGRERQMDRHLVAVKVRVVRRTRERMQLQRTALGEHRLECLNAEAVQRRRAVEEHGVLLDDIFEHVPDLGARALDHALC